jgi:hypothetical protein
MHTVKVIAAGLALLAVFALVGHWLARSQGAGGGARAALYFIGVWLLLAIANLVLGVLSAGYSVREELPIFLLVFAVPTLVALVLRRLLRAT